MNRTNNVLFVAWQDQATRQIFPVGRLLRRPATPETAAHTWEFVYLQGARDAEGFRPFQGLPELGEIYRGAELPPFLRNRLMPKSRPDRARFIERLGLDPDVSDEIPILARSEGIKETDAIEVFGLPYYVAATGSYHYSFFVRGIRYVAGAEDRILRLAVGEQLRLVGEPDNDSDPGAILVNATDGARLGWVPRTLVEDLNDLLRRRSSLSVTVNRVNPASAPVQLRLLCNLEAEGTEGFIPFSSARYQPISAEAGLVDIQAESRNSKVPVR